MDKKIYMSIMAVLATMGAIWLLALFMAPFLKPLIWALVIGIATMPHRDRVGRLLPNHPNMSAGIMVLIITFCIIMPFALLVIIIAQNATEWYNQSEKLVMAFTESLPITISSLPIGNKALAWANRFGIDLAGYAAKFAANASQFFLDTATSAAKNVADFVVALAMMLFILFFIYRDGEKVVSAGIARFAGNKEKTLSYLYDIRSTTTAVTVGTFLTCLVQGILAGFGYFAVGLPAPALCGALTAVMALVPLVGTAIVWVPLVTLLVINGTYLKALLLMIWCLVFVIFAADSVIRPLAIGARKSIPILAIVLGAVGGVVAVGIIGLIVGPLFFAILAAVWREATGNGTRQQLDNNNG